jgi:hypothetical protein
VIQARCEKNRVLPSTATVGLELESALDALIGIGRAERPSVTVLERDRSSRYILQDVRPKLEPSCNLVNSITLVSLICDK